MYSFPSWVDEWKVQVFDHMKELLILWCFGEADDTSVYSIAENGCGFVDFFSAFFAEDFEVGLIDELDEAMCTTILSQGCGSSSIFLADSMGTTSSL